MSGLAHYDQARRGLEAACTVDEAKAIHDKSEALRAYARQIDDADLESWTSEIKIRARDRIGELSAELERAATGPKPKAALLPTGGQKLKSSALRDAGLSHATAQRCEQVHRAFKKSKKKVEEFIAEKRAKKQPITERQVLQIFKDAEIKDKRAHYEARAERGGGPLKTSRRWRPRAGGSR